ncbi:hypothetical protein AQUCO_02700251v1 [Aquilegia coerulea]|uniref:Cytochrome P450 n=1 Tax=Aquilegia coerulea TaxID=218851 RepID=A0A2G5D5Y0_AQUCA|nr:hypothetical protein AQUCO_02700251v1 [Aquilegia coerulea]
MEIQYLVASILVALFITYTLLRKKHHQKKLPPSPQSLPIIGHFHLLVNKPIHIAIGNLLQKYGPILFLRFGFRPVLILSSPTAIKECFTKNDIIFANRPSMLLGKIVDKYEAVAMISYGDTWRNLRRLTTTEIFSTIRLDMSSNIRKEEVSSVIRQMYKGYDGEFKQVELKSIFCKLAFNINAKVFGTKPFFGEEEMADHKKAKDKLDELKSLFLPNEILFGAGDFFPFLKWLDHWTVEKIMLKFHHKRDKFMQDMIDDHRSTRAASSSFSRSNTNEDMKEEMEKKRSLIDVLLSLKETEAEYYTDDIIKGVILVMFATGIETSTTTMEWAMSLLLNHPEVLKKARNEIDFNVGHDRLLNESDFINLPYLHNIINETLRMCTLQPFLAPHESSEDCTIGGYHIPKGTMLLINQLALHNDPKIWPEPTMFKPERFQKEFGENEGTKWIPFGQGRRACPGEGLGMRIMALMLGSLIQCYDLDLVEGEMVDVSIGERRIMGKAKPLEAMYRPRKPLVDVLSEI